MCTCIHAYAYTYTSMLEGRSLVGRWQGGVGWTLISACMFPVRPLGRYPNHVESVHTPLLIRRIGYTGLADHTMFLFAEGRCWLYDLSASGFPCSFLFGGLRHPPAPQHPPEPRKAPQSTVFHPRCVYNKFDACCLFFSNLCFFVFAFIYLIRILIISSFFIRL